MWAFCNNSADTRCRLAIFESEEVSAGRFLLIPALLPELLLALLMIVSRSGSRSLGRGTMIRRSSSMSDALVGGEDANGDGLVGDVFLLLFNETPELVARLFWLASEGARFMMELTAGACALTGALIRLLSGVPELELLSSSTSRGRFAGNFAAGFVGFAIT